MADEQQPPPQRFWFPWGAAVPQPPAPAPRPAVRPQLSRRDTRPAPPQPSPPVTPSPSRRQAHPQPGATPASRGAGGVPSPPAPAQPQPTRLSSRPSPSPSRAPPLSPIREPNARAAPTPATEPVPIAKEDKPPLKPATPPLHPTTAYDVPKQKDIVIPLEKTIKEPPAADSKAQSKVLEKEKEEKDKDKGKKEKEKEKEKEKDKEKKKKEHKDKKEKEKEHKEEKEHEDKKEKEKDHKEKEKEEHGSKLQKELKAGVADMVHKLSSTPPSSGGTDRHASAAAGTTVITLAGENKGASMKVDRSAVADGKADSKDKERRGHKLDGSVVIDGKEQAGGRGLTAFVNSNVQVINNSLLLQSSCNGRDPGVHLKLSTKSKKKGDGEEAGGK